MPGPTYGAHVFQTPQNESSAQRATPRPIAAAPTPKVIANLLAQVPGISTPERSGMSFRDVAAALRCLAALLEAESSYLPADKTAHVGDTTSKYESIVKLSFEAEELLETIVERRTASGKAPRDRVWIGKCDWLEQAGMRRDRKDAETLFAELIDVGFVDVRQHGPQKGWTQYRVTPQGVQYTNSRSR